MNNSFDFSLPNHPRRVVGRLAAIAAACGGLWALPSNAQDSARDPAMQHPSNVHQAYPHDDVDLNRGNDFDDRFEPDLEGRFRNEWRESYWEEEIEDDRADNFFVEAYERSGNDYTIDYDYDYDYGAYDEPGDDVADYDDVSDNAFDYEGQFAYGNDELDYSDVYDDYDYENGVESFVEVPFESDAVADYAESGALGDEEYERFYDNYGVFDPQYDTSVYQRDYRSRLSRRSPGRSSGRSVAADVRADIIDDDYDIVGSELARDDATSNRLSDAGMKEGSVAKSADLDYEFDQVFGDTGAAEHWYYTDQWHTDDSAFDRWYE